MMQPTRKRKASQATRPAKRGRTSLISGKAKIVWIEGETLPPKKELARLIRSHGLMVGDVLLTKKGLRSCGTVMVTQSIPPAWEDFNDGAGYMRLPRWFTRKFADPITFWGPDLIGYYHGIWELELDCVAHGDWLAQRHTGGRPLHPDCQIRCEADYRSEAGKLYMEILSPPSDDIPGPDRRHWVELDEDTPDVYLQAPHDELKRDPVMAMWRFNNTRVAAMLRPKVGENIMLIGAPNPNDNRVKGFGRASSWVTVVEYKQFPTGKRVPIMSWDRLGPITDDTMQDEMVETMMVKDDKNNKVVPMQRQVLTTCGGPFSRVSAWCTRDPDLCADAQAPFGLTPYSSNFRY
jgi:hypothetical protein